MRRCDSVRLSVSLRGSLLELADKIDRHGLGWEGWEDSPAHGWAEELRDMAECAEEICDELVRMEGQTHGYPTEEELSPMMRARLMPEGMEWPRFEDGEPVRIGDRFVHYSGIWDEVKSFNFKDGLFRLDGALSESYGYGERVHRRSIFSSDGRLIRRGDTVYGQSDSKAWKVTGIDWGNPDYPIHAVNRYGTERNLKPKWLTHERPVIKDANEDSVPNASSDVLNEGDSWEKLERDMELFGRYYAGTDPDENDRERDALVRRAKKLAGVEE